MKVRVVSTKDKNLAESQHAGGRLQDITRQRLERLVCELKLRYSKYSRLSVAIFTTYKAAKITNFTYEQEGYTDLAVRGESLDSLVKFLA